MIAARCINIATALLANEALTPAAKLILTVLHYRQGKNGAAWPGQDCLGEDVGVKSKAVRRATRELEEAGWIRIKKRDRQGRGQTLRYTLTDRLRKAIEQGPFSDTLADGKGIESTGERVSNRPLNRRERRGERKAPASTPFVPPTVEAVRDYASSRGLPDFNAQRFIDYYAAADWTDAKGNAVHNWKQKLISVWEPKAKSGQTPTASTPSFDDPSAWGCEEAEGAELLKGVPHD